MFIVAQAMGIIGMPLNILSYQFKKQRSIILCQMFGALFRYREEKGDMA